MARRAESGFHRGRVWRIAVAGVATSATGLFGLGGTLAHADEPPAEPELPVETGEIDGAIVAVGTPPVPPTTIEVAVGEPPVPVTSIEVAVGEPPVPPVTIPDAIPSTELSPAALATSAPRPHTSAPTSASAATAIVASAAASVGDALWALVRGS